MENYRLIVEENIGRKLLSDEIIHHKDGNSHNNIIENLEITNSSEHHKKRHLTSEDWAKIILDLLQKKINITPEILNQNLSIFFTERQKQIIFRRVYGLELSKTEREYYSRTIRKKLLALANPTLHQIFFDMIYR